MFDLKPTQIFQAPKFFLQPLLEFELGFWVRDGNPIKNYLVTSLESEMEISRKVCAS